MDTMNWLDRPDPTDAYRFGEEESAPDLKNSFNSFEDDILSESENDLDIDASHILGEEMFSDDDDSNGEIRDFEEEEKGYKSKFFESGGDETEPDSVDEHSFRNRIDPSAHEPSRYDDRYRIKPDPYDEDDRPDPFNEEKKDDPYIEESTVNSSNMEISSDDDEHDIESQPMSYMTFGFDNEDDNELYTGSFDLKRSFRDLPSASETRGESGIEVEEIVEFDSVSKKEEDISRDEFDDEPKEESNATVQTSRERRIITCLSCFVFCLIILLLIAIAVGIGVGVRKNKESQSTPTTPPAFPPSIAPTSRPIIAMTMPPTPPPTTPPTTPPTFFPSSAPTLQLTTLTPSTNPSVSPTLQTSISPTNFPTEASPQPTVRTSAPSIAPTNVITIPATSPPVEEPSPVNEPSPVEEPSPVNEPSPVEEPSPVNEPSPMEEPSPVDEPSPINVPSEIPEPTTPATVLPTGPSIVSPSSPNMGLLQFLIAHSFDGGKAIMKDGTPQNEAYKWLLTNAFLSLYSEAQKLSRYSLATFFFATNGRTTWDSFIRDDGWLTDAPECEWGSTANNQCTKGVYTSLTLDFVGVSGTIPQELGLLTGLERFSVRGSTETSNIMSGSIPDIFGKLSNIQTIRLNDNSLTGLIPASFGSMKNCIVLILSGNSLIGKIPTELAKTQGRTFNFSNNQLSGRIPSELFALTELKILNLQNNFLSGAIPSEIGYATSISNINLSNNQLGGSIPSEIGNLVEIRSAINLSSNNLSGKIPTEIGRLNKMRNFEVQNNLLAGSIPVQLSGLINIELFRIDGNTGIVGSLPESVCETFGKTVISYSECGLESFDCDCCTYCCDRGICECNIDDADICGDDLTGARAPRFLSN